MEFSEMGLLGITVSLEGYDSFNQGYFLPMGEPSRPPSPVALS